MIEKKMVQFSKKLIKKNKIKNIKINLKTLLNLILKNLI